MPERPKQEAGGEITADEAEIEVSEASEAVKFALGGAVGELKKEEKTRAPETNKWIGGAKSLFAKTGKGLLKGLWYGLIIASVAAVYITLKTVEKTSERGAKKLGVSIKSSKKSSKKS